MKRLLPLIQHTLDLDVIIAEDTPLLSSGLVDSFGLVVLLGEIEAEYGVVIDEADLGADAFDTPRQILERIRTAEMRT